MAVRVLIRQMEFRRRLLKAGWHEYGIVTEAAQASGLIDDVTVPSAVGHYGRQVSGAAYISDHTAIARGSFRCGDIPKLLQHLAQIVRVAGAFAGVSRGEDAWTTTQCINLDA